MVDDDEEFARLVAEYFGAEGGFSVTMRHDGASGVDAAVSEPFDVGLPKINGFEALKQIRQQVDTPVVMLTARGDDIDRILGLEIGADDYVPKPCNLRELVARIRAILRRLNKQEDAGAANDRTVVGDLKIEPGSQSVFHGDRLVPLTGAEYLVLEALIQSGIVPSPDHVSARLEGCM